MDFNSLQENSSQWHHHCTPKYNILALTNITSNHVIKQHPSVQYIYCQNHSAIVPLRKTTALGTSLLIYWSPVKCSSHLAITVTLQNTTVYVYSSDIKSYKSCFFKIWKCISSFFSQQLNLNSTRNPTMFRQVINCISYRDK